MQKNKEKYFFILMFAIVIYSLLPEFSFESFNIVGRFNLSFSNKINVSFVFLFLGICYFKKFTKLLNGFIIGLYVMYVASLLFLR